MPEWSVETRVMTHPFALYAELAEMEDAEAASLALWRPVALLAGIGAVVSLTTAGRLVAMHVVGTMVFWSFLPALQATAIAFSLRFAAREKSLRRAIGLYFIGHGPWYFFLLSLTGVLLFAPSAYGAFTALLRYGVLPIAILVSAGWGGMITYACFRSGLELPRRRAAAATALFYLAYVGAIVGYYLAMNQIQPQVFGVPA